MATFVGTITDFAAGDTLLVERTITQVPSGTVMVTAWLTVKRDFRDIDSAAIFQKKITSAAVAGVGHIDDTGADGTGHVIFMLEDTDTEKLYPLSEYQYDIQVRLSDDTISTPEVGKITAMPQITLSIT